MTRKILLAAAATMLAAPVAFAQDAEPTGDAQAGEAAFRQCIACHVVVNDEGETLAGRNARTGPNLYGVVGRAAGVVEDFRYSAGLQALAENEIVWEEENFVAYVQDPTAYIREATGNNSLRGSMSFRVRSADQAADLYAYLASLQAE
ncbi:Cytochrome c2 [Roseibacterium elongatum DSM 19469]|uniref:Cytochrome c2 n=1 Tax=Roseicyclus elongatus DSM 19469 TaxID=1294273 RepID=W8RR15_9RHOB|nr:c-type cytochrome [Roseibacterium elongatum]AHM03508.1 Cytochrome c2 [Roseibacterium elongatum DSM 19469]